MKKKILLLSLCGALFLTGDVSGTLVDRQVYPTEKHPEIALAKMRAMKLQQIENLKRVQELLKDWQNIDVKSLVEDLKLLDESEKVKVWKGLMGKDGRGFTGLNHLMQNLKDVELGAVLTSILPESINKKDAKEIWKYLMIKNDSGATLLHRVVKSFNGADFYNKLERFLKPFMKAMRAGKVWGGLMTPDKYGFTATYWFFTYCTDDASYNRLEAFLKPFIKAIGADNVWKDLVAKDNFGFTVLLEILQNVGEASDSLFAFIERFAEKNRKSRDAVVEELKHLNLWNPIARERVRRLIHQIRSL